MKTSWRDTFWLTVLPVAIGMSFTLPKPLAIVQAAMCGALFGAKLMLFTVEREQQREKEKDNA